jgi:hypothetical protein
MSNHLIFRRTLAHETIEFQPSGDRCNPLSVKISVLPQKCSEEFVILSSAVVIANQAAALSDAPACTEASFGKDAPGALPGGSRGMELVGRVM